MLMDAFAIKIFASICMAIDHVGAVFPMFTYPFFRWIGRIAMPIYVYLIAEGCMHTKDINRYMLRLGVFALLSEIPFDLAFWQDYHIAKEQPLYINFLSTANVYYTLFFGVACINIHEKAKQNALAYKSFVHSTFMKSDENARNRSEREYIVTFLLMLLFVAISVAAIFSPAYSKITLVSVILLYVFFFLFGWPRIFAHQRNKHEAMPKSEPLCSANGNEHENCLRKDESTSWSTVLPVLPVLAMGDILNTDYGSFAVALIFVLYLAKSRRRRMLLLSAGILLEYGVPILELGANSYNILSLLFALISVAVLFSYNGKPGMRWKWAFYWFYPIHIALLALILILFVRPMSNGF
jgi:hypothetical protein